MWRRFRWIGPGVCTYHGEVLGGPGDEVTTKLVTDQWIDDQVRLGTAERI